MRRILYYGILFVMLSVNVSYGFPVSDGELKFLFYIQTGNTEVDDIAHDGTFLWAIGSVYNASTIYKINAQTGDILATRYFVNFSDPTGLEYISRNNEKYLWSIGIDGPSGKQVLVKIDPITLKLKTHCFLRDLGPYYDGLAYDQYNGLYTTHPGYCPFPPYLDIIDLNTNEIKENIGVYDWLDTASIDYKTRLTYERSRNRLWIYSRITSSWDRGITNIRPYSDDEIFGIALPDLMYNGLTYDPNRKQILIAAGQHIYAVVPEPCTVLLMGSGLVALAGFTRRRRRS